MLTKEEVDKWLNLTENNRLKIHTLIDENERLRSMFREIKMNTKSASLTLPQAHYKLENINIISRAALREVDGGKD